MEGQTRGLKAFGIVVTEQEVLQEALALGWTGTATELDAATKAQLTWDVILERSTLIQGQYQKRAGELPQVLAGIKSGFKDLISDIGQELLGPLADFLKPLEAWVQRLKKNLLNSKQDFADFFLMLEEAGKVVVEALGILAEAFGIDIGTGDFIDGMNDATNAMGNFVVWWDTGGGREAFKRWAHDFKDSVYEVIQTIEHMVRTITNWVENHITLIEVLAVGLLVFPLVTAALGALADALLILPNLTWLVCGAVEALAAFCGIAGGEAAVLTVRVGGAVADASDRGLDGQLFG